MLFISNFGFSQVPKNTKKAQKGLRTANVGVGFWGIWGYSLKDLHEPGINSDKPSAEAGERQPVTNTPPKRLYTSRVGHGKVWNTI